jgi:hypothetical protein
LFASDIASGIHFFSIRFDHWSMVYWKSDLRVQGGENAGGRATIGNLAIGL